MQPVHTMHPITLGGGGIYDLKPDDGHNISSY